MPITALQGLVIPYPGDPDFDAHTEDFIAAWPDMAEQANALEASLIASVHSGTSTTSAAISVGSKSFATQPGKAWLAGTWLTVAHTTAPGNYMLGQVASYNSGTGALVLSVVSVAGSGTYASWTIGLGQPHAGADNIVGGTAGALAYQVGPGDTAFIPPGPAGYVLTTPGGTAAPSWAPVGVPAGAVMPFAMSTAPAGWLPADGAAVSRVTYAALFAAIGTTFGVGDGSTTFNLPDLRGEFVRGWDAGRGVDSGRALGSSQADELKAHSHVGGTRRVWDGADGEYGSVARGGIDSPVARYTNGSAAYDLDNTNSTGGTETRPRNVAMRLCIKT